MPRTVLFRAVFAALLTTAVSLAWAKSGATGTVTIDGKSWPVADAVAISENGDLEIVFSQVEFDRSQWDDNGEFDSFDLYRVKDDADGQAFTMDIDEEDGGYGGHNVRYSAGSTSGGFNSDLEGSVTLSANDATHVAGMVKFDDGNGVTADIAFDLPVSKTGPLAPSGTPLPAGGGEPGKALQAMVDATHAGNLDRIIALSHPDRRQEIEQAKAAGEAGEILKMVQAFTPKITRITGGNVDGDAARVDFDGTEESAAVKGSAELTRSGGQWYIKSINTKSGG